MSLRLRRLRACLALASLAVCPGVTAAPVSWVVDSSVSFIRLTVPDQDVQVEGLGTVTVRLRDAASSSQWTDAGGRRFAVGGQITTEYVNFTSIEFLPGSPLFALEQTNLRPDPAQWDPVAAEYVGTAAAPAAFGARVLGTFLIFTFEGAYAAFREVWMDVASEVILLDPAGTIPAGSTRFGIAQAASDVDGLELPLGFGQPIPDLLHEPLPPIEETNAGGGVIENLGGLERRLTYTITAAVEIQLGDVTVAGSAEGLIVAYATIPGVAVPFDFEGDGDVDHGDFVVFASCSTGPAVASLPPGCSPAAFAMADADQDLDVDHDDFGGFQRCYSGRNVAADANCNN